MASVLPLADPDPVLDTILAPRSSDKGPKSNPNRRLDTDLLDDVPSVRRRVARILVVDDDEGIRRQLRFLLEDEGYEVEVAATGSAALSAADAVAFDVVILDVRLPDVSGIEVFEAFRRRSDALKTIIISGFLVDDEIARAEEQGAHYLAKPVDSDRLLSLLSGLGRKGKTP